MRRKYKPFAIEGKFYLGLILLFDIENGELRAVTHDGYVNQMVTGATGALSVKYLAPDDEPHDVLEAIDNGATDWDSIAELGRIIAGTDAGRCDNNQITLHRHYYTGLGLWYTAAGHALFEAAVAAGAGRDVPDELFNQLYVT